MVQRLLAAAAIILCCSISAGAQDKADSTKTVLPDGTTVINTTTIGKAIDGWNGPTPVEISITGGKISQITPLPNDEENKYFNRAVELLEKFIGLTPKEGIEANVDAVSGATWSSKALIKNIKLGLQYAEEHK